MNLASTDLRQQLKTPDRTGRDLALLRTRLYRFSSDQRWYVLAESLEENYLAGRHPKAATMTAVRSCLDKIRHDGSPIAFRDDLADSRGHRHRRGPGGARPLHVAARPPAAPPRKVVIIVGAPRSGTSHLFNLLAATGKFAYFTTASCWAWPVRNLHQPGRATISPMLTDTVLEVDNKRTRSSPALIMPGEAEDIWHRAMPVYRTFADTATTSARRRARQPAHPAGSSARPPRPLQRRPCCSPNRRSTPSASPDRTALGRHWSGISTSSATSTRQPTRCAATTSNSPQMAICLLRNWPGHGSSARSTAMRPQAGRRPSARAAHEQPGTRGGVDHGMEGNESIILDIPLPGGGSITMSMSRHQFAQLPAISTLSSALPGSRNAEDAARAVPTMSLSGLPEGSRSVRSDEGRLQEVFVTCGNTDEQDHTSRLDLGRGSSGCDVPLRWRLFVTRLNWVLMLPDRYEYPGGIVSRCSFSASRRMFRWTFSVQ